MLKAFRDLTARKMRTLLVVLSIAVGVFGVSTVIRLSSQINSSLTDQFNRSNPPDITLNTSSVGTPVIDQLATIPNAQAIEGRITSFGRWTPEDSLTDVQIVGVRDFDRPDGIGKTTLKQGAFPKPGEILLESSTRKYYGLKVGETVSILGAAGEVPLTISGSGDNATYQPAAIAGFGTAFVTMDDAAKLAGFADPNTLFAKVQDIDQAETTAAAMRGVLAQNGAVVNGLEIRDPDNPPGEEVSGVIGALLGVFAIIALITSSFLVVNTIATVVAEQRNQIGAMKAVGATTGTIMRIYLALALMYGVIGTVVGLLLGLAGSYLLLAAMQSFLAVDVGSFQISPIALVVGALIGLGVPLIAALLPVWLGSRVTIREAIMSYGLASSFGRGILARIALALVFMPQTLVLASRNLLRNRLRVILTVIGLAAAGASVISVYNANRSLADTINDAVKIYKVDMVFDLSEPALLDRATAAINTVPGVQFSEGSFATAVQTEENFNDNLTGMPVDTRAYDTSKVIEGRWFEAGDTDAVVITEQMARKRDLKLGDTVELNVGDQTVRWRIVGITRDLFSGDNTFFAPIEQATRAAGAPAGTVQTMLVKLDDSSRANVDAKFDAINEALITGGVPAHGQVVYKTEEQALSTFTILFVLMYAVVVVVAVVGGLGLFGTITMNVLERRREIGVMRSVGASTGNVLTVFLAEALLLGALGWVTAVVLGFFGARLFGRLISSVLLPLTVTIKPESLVLTLVMVMLVAFLAALVPSISAARTRIAEILRYS